MRLNKRMKTRDTQLIQDIPKSNTTQNDFVETIALRETLVKKFDRIKVLDENISNILIDQDKSQEEIDAEDENANNFSIHFKTEIFKVSKFIDQF